MFMIMYNITIMSKLAPDQQFGSLQVIYLTIQGRVQHSGKHVFLLSLLPRNSLALNL